MRELKTLHGTLQLPAFLPDGTRGAVRGLDAQDLHATGTPGVVMNTYHLMLHPGAKVISRVGGLHRFTGWNGPILTDSGGFQVFSLLRENPAFGTIRRNEVIFSPSREVGKLHLSPEKCMQVQLSLRSDIVMCLDWCTHPDDPHDVQRKAVETTVRWAGQCRAEFDRLAAQQYAGKSARPLLFAIIQGGTDRSLRRECAESLREIGFDGYAFGGWPVDKEYQLVADTLAYTAELMPPDRPRYAMGVGKPENVVACARMGYNLFDCVIPTRDARHLRLYVFTAETPRLDGKEFYRTLYLQDPEHRWDESPLSATCDCHTCQHYSRAYLHHLFRVEDPLAPRLATIHNLRFYARLMELITQEVSPCLATTL